MNAETMMVDPNELVIDMPLDEANVKTKVESMHNNGMIQDVTVWLQDMRIIDGFHRTAAARQLGWKGVRCKVVDCSEAAFWDARIQSAKQHHTIEKQRLESWIISCWESTDWDEELILDEVEQLNKDAKGIFDMVLSELRYKSELKADSLRSCNIKPARQDEIIAAWRGDGVTTWHQVAAIPDDELRRRFNLNKTQLTHIRWRQKWQTEEPEKPIDMIARKNGNKAAAAAIASWNILMKGKELSEKDMPAIYAWFREKAKQWGETPSYLARVILQSRYVGHVGQRLADGYEQHIAKELDLSLSEAYLLSPYIPDTYTVNTRYDRSAEKAAQPLREFLNERQPGQSREEYNEQVRQAAALEQQKTIERRQVYEQSEAGKEAARKALIENSRGYMRDLLLTARDRVTTCRYHIGNVPDAPAMIAEFAQFVADFSAEHFPDMQVATPNPVALENSRLRAENAKLKERIASLERALGSKQAAGEMLSNAMAWSSGDLER